MLFKFSVAVFCYWKTSILNSEWYNFSSIFNAHKCTIVSLFQNLSDMSTMFFLLVSFISIWNYIWNELIPLVYKWINRMHATLSVFEGFYSFFSEKYQTVPVWSHLFVCLLLFFSEKKNRVQTFTLRTFDSLFIAEWITTITFKVTTCCELDDFLLQLHSHSLSAFSKNI